MRCSSEYGALLHRTILRVCPRELGLSCDDIEQEARLSLWKALQSGREIAFPVSYIYKVAVSATLRAIRRAKARREDPLNEDSDAADRCSSCALRPKPRHMQSPSGRSVAQKIEAALAQLPENRRLAVENHLQGLTTPRDWRRSSGGASPRPAIWCTAGSKTCGWRCAPSGLSASR